MIIRAKSLPVRHLIWCIFFLAFFIFSYYKSNHWLALISIGFIVIYLLFYFSINIFKPVMLEITDDYIISRQNILRQKIQIKRSNIVKVYIRQQNRFIKALINKEADDDVIIETKYGRKLVIMPMSFEMDSKAIFQHLTI